MSNEKTKQGITVSKRTLIIALAVIVLLVGGAVTLGLNWNNWFGDKTQTAVSDKATPDIDPNAGDWKGENPTDKGGASEGIKIPGYPSITLPANTENVSVALLNPEGNPCYFTFELVLKDSGETLYKSKLVPPGKAVTDITLSQPLKAGKYDATIKISTCSLNDLSAMNGANVETVLIVQ